jgi:hypothetical protein
MVLKGNGKNLPAHTNKVFALKFDKKDENLLYSAGWDDTVKVNDLRIGGPV